MAEKALVAKIYAVAREESPSTLFTLTAEVGVTNGAGAGQVVIYVEATATTFNPVLPNWKTRLQTAIIDEALAQLDVEVDEVLFPDLSIL